jgi:hypothetical protein
MKDALLFFPKQVSLGMERVVVTIIKQYLPHMPRNDTTLASSMINYSLSDCAKNFAQVSY